MADGMAQIEDFISGVVAQQIGETRSEVMVFGDEDSPPLIGSGLYPQALCDAAAWAGSLDAIGQEHIRSLIQFAEKGGVFGLLNILDGTARAMSDSEVEVGVYFRRGKDVTFSREASTDLHDAYARRIAEFEEGA
jgi:hypothetical protein